MLLFEATSQNILVGLKEKYYDVLECKKSETRGNMQNE